MNGSGASQCRDVIALLLPSIRRDVQTLATAKRVLICVYCKSDHVVKLAVVCFSFSMKLDLFL